jgi:hypothetical protein
MGTYGYFGRVILFVLLFVSPLWVTLCCYRRVNDHWFDTADSEHCWLGGALHAPSQGNCRVVLAMFTRVNSGVPLGVCDLFLATACEEVINPWVPDNPFCGQYEDPIQGVPTNNSVFCHDFCKLVMPSCTWQTNCWGKSRVITCLLMYSIRFLNSLVRCTLPISGKDKSIPGFEAYFVFLRVVNLRICNLCLSVHSSCTWPLSGWDKSLWTMKMSDAFSGVALVSRTLSTSDGGESSWGSTALSDFFDLPFQPHLSRTMQPNCVGESCGFIHKGVLAIRCFPLCFSPIVPFGGFYTYIFGLMGILAPLTSLVDWTEYSGRRSTQYCLGEK